MCLSVYSRCSDFVQILRECSLEPWFQLTCGKFTVDSIPSYEKSPLTRLTNALLSQLLPAIPENVKKIKVAADHGKRTDEPVKVAVDSGNVSAEKAKIGLKL